MKCRGQVVSCVVVELGSLAELANYNEDYRLGNTPAVLIDPFQHWLEGEAEC